MEKCEGIFFVCVCVCVCVRACVRVCACMRVCACVDVDVCYAAVFTVQTMAGGSCSLSQVLLGLHTRQLHLVEV